LLGAWSFGLRQFADVRDRANGCSTPTRSLRPRTCAKAPPIAPLTSFVAAPQNVKSTFTKAEKDGALSGVIELKKNMSGVDVTGKLDTKSNVNLVLEHGAHAPSPQRRPTAPCPTRLRLPPLAPRRPKLGAQRCFTTR
jgi:hypothetical protein